MRQRPPTASFFDSLQHSCVRIFTRSSDRTSGNLHGIDVIEQITADNTFAFQETTKSSPDRGLSLPRLANDHTRARVHHLRNLLCSLRSLGTRSPRENNILDDLRDEAVLSLCGDLRAGGSKYNHESG